MAAIVDTMKDSEIEELYHNMTDDDLQNMLCQEKCLNRRQLLRKELRARKKITSSQVVNEPTKSEIFKGNQDTSHLSTESTKIKEENENKDNSFQSLITIQKELEELTKELRGTLDMVARRDLRSRMKILQTSLDSMTGKEGQVASIKLDSQIFANEKFKAKATEMNKQGPTSSSDNISESSSTAISIKPNIEIETKFLKSSQESKRKMTDNDAMHPQTRLSKESSFKNDSSNITNIIKDDHDKILETDSRTMTKAYNVIQTKPESKNTPTISVITSPRKDDIMKVTKQTPPNKIDDSKTFKTTTTNKTNESASNDILPKPSQGSTLSQIRPNPTLQIKDTIETNSKGTDLSSVTSMRERFEKKPETNQGENSPNINVRRKVAVPATSGKELDDIINELLGTTDDSVSNLPACSRTLAPPLQPERKTSQTLCPPIQPGQNVRRKSSVKDLLMLWIRLNTEQYKNVNIVNYSNSWADGLAFCALIHHFYPESFDYSKLNSTNRSDNFNLAFKIAKERAGIAPLLDTDDMVNTDNPDWKCVYTYVQMMYKELKNHPRNVLKKPEESND